MSNSTLTDSTFTGAFICHRIKPEYIGLDKCYSFPFASTAVATATATAIAKG